MSNIDYKKIQGGDSFCFAVSFSLNKKVSIETLNNVSEKLISASLIEFSNTGFFDHRCIVSGLGFFSSFQNILPLKPSSIYSLAQ
ncbi:hypothetical protein [Methylomonas sp. AM2-LC]|uniref:hypothetical protein n=1 Tax=Methylomonas sp. AM2-LC TaxID=3153301 RepID=UPI0032661887